MRAFGQGAAVRARTLRTDALAVSADDARTFIAAFLVSALGGGTGTTTASPAQAQRGCGAAAGQLSKLPRGGAERNPCSVMRRCALWRGCTVRLLRSAQNRKHRCPPVSAPSSLGDELTSACMIAFCTASAVDGSYSMITSVCATSAEITCQDLASVIHFHM